MQNNELFLSLCDIFELEDTAIVDVFQLVNYAIDLEQVEEWLMAAEEASLSALEELEVDDESIDGDDDDIEFAGDNPVSDSEQPAASEQEPSNEGTPLTDEVLATFLNGLIALKRGPREDGPPEPEKRLSNNDVLRKIKIALNMQADDMLAVFEVAEHIISKHELSAMFRRVKHKHYRKCSDDVLHCFLDGLMEQQEMNASGETL